MTVQEALGVLGVNPSASDQAIREAYRDLVAVWHPDRHAGNERLRRKAEEKLKLLNAAFELLRDGSWRKAWENNASQDADSAWAGFRPGGNDDGPTDMGDDPFDAAARSRIKGTAGPLILLLALLIPVAFAVRDATATDGSGTATSASTLDGEPRQEVAKTEDGVNGGTSSLKVPGAEVHNNSLHSPGPVTVTSPETGRTYRVTFSTPFSDGDIEEIWKQGDAGKIAPWVDPTKTKSNAAARDDNDPGRDSATDAALQQPTEFTVGSSQEEVISVQGTPTSINDYGSGRKTLWYGTSRVGIRNGVVVDYDNSSNNLKVIVKPLRLSTGENWRVGATEDEILSTQGTPTSINDYGSGRKTLWYGTSRIGIRNGVVVDYDNSSNNLKVTVKPLRVSSGETWRVGATEDEVLSIQGTPTSINDYGTGRKTLWYGTSRVGIRNGVVVDYDNSGGNLRVTGLIPHHSQR